MKTIPETTPDRYITGFDALNIPLADGRAADWHFRSAFIESDRVARIAGADYPETNSVFGRYGVRECGGPLRAAGRPDAAGEVWAADFVRAILDLVYRSAVVEKVRPDHVPAGDLLDADWERDALRTKLAELKSKVSAEARNLIEQWESRQLA